MNPIAEARSHKWRRETTWWDDLEFDAEAREKYKDTGVFAWLSEIAPDPTEHDFILYTDGSGCDRGWGGFAAVIQRIDLNTDTDVREVVNTECLVHASYGSTVQRCEMTAFLDGVHRILNTRAGEIIEASMIDPAERYEVSTEGPLSKLSGPDRPTILWYTDRANLAKSLLFDEHGNVLNSRSSEADLWMRWSAMARFCCVTPMCTPRNTVDGQELCDTLAGFGRNLLKLQMDALQEHTKQFIKPVQWTNPTNQKAHF